MNTIALKTWASAAVCVVVLTTCGKRNDPISNPTEPRITSFTVPFAQTTFRGDTILVRLDASYLGTSIQPIIAFKGAPSLSPGSGETQEFEAKPALTYSLQTANAVKRYTVVVVPTAPLRIDWLETQKTVDNCNQATQFAKVGLWNVGTVIPGHEVQLTFQDALSGKSSVYEKYFLGNLAGPGVHLEYLASSQLGIFSLAVEYRDLLGTIRKAQSQTQLSVREQTVPKPYQPVPVLMAGGLAGFLACGLLERESYQIVFKDSLNRTYSAPLRYTSLAVPALFTIPANLPTGPVEVSVIHRENEYPFGRTGVIRDLNKPHIQRSLVRTHGSEDTYPYVSGAYTNQFKSGQDIILLHRSLNTGIDGTGAFKTVYVKFSVQGKEIRRLYTLGARVRDGGFPGVQAQIPIDLKGTFQVSLLIQEPDGTFTETEPYWDKIRIE